MPRPQASYEYVKGIFVKTGGLEMGPDDPKLATPEDPLVLVLRRSLRPSNNYRPPRDGDLVGGRVHDEVGESSRAALLRETRRETGLTLGEIGRPIPAWSNTIDDSRFGKDGSVTPVNVVHRFYVARVDLRADVDPAALARPEADNDAREWLLLSRAIGEISIESQQLALAWVGERRLWELAEQPHADAWAAEQRLWDQAVAPTAD
jgi:8-oxo-dGTP pyrophosphatase MutT (NUDIX family)